MSERAAGRHFGISRESVKKMLCFSVPPGYRRTAPVRRPKLDGFSEIIDQWLKDDPDQPRKQRHTAKRIFDRLRAEHGFSGGYTIVKDYVREHHRRRREMFVPLIHPPGHGQADFGEARAVIGGVARKAHFFVFDLPHSDACYVRAYPAATAEAWIDGLGVHGADVHAFAFFGGVPQSVLYDNDRCLVSRILADGTRRRARLFGGFLSHYLVRDRYGRPGKGRQTTRARWRVWWALPGATSWCRFRALPAGKRSICGSRSSAAAARAISCAGTERPSGSAWCGIWRPWRAPGAAPPAAPFEACAQAPGQVSSQSLVRYETNDYSVPVAYGHRDVWVRGYVDRVVIGCGGEVIARHPRSYEREDTIFEPIHYLPLIEQKIGALDQAAPLAGWDLPPAFQTLRRLMEARSGRAGRREYVQVLRLLESFGLEDLHGAVKDALRLGAIGFDAVKHLVLCRLEKRPPKLDLDVYPYLPKATVGRTSAASYMCLLSEDAA